MMLTRNLYQRLHMANEICCQKITNSYFIFRLLPYLELFIEQVSLVEYHAIEERFILGIVAEFLFKY